MGVGVLVLLVMVVLVVMVLSEEGLVGLWFRCWVRKGGVGVRVEVESEGEGEIVARR